MPYTNHADLGGRPGFGPVVRDAETSVFHAAWEARVLALSLAMGATGCWNLDMFRAARDTLPNYLDLRYYEIWLGGLENLLVAKGLVTAEELAAGRAQHPPAPAAQHPPSPAARILTADQVAARLANGTPSEMASARVCLDRSASRARRVLVARMVERPIAGDPLLRASRRSIAW